MIDNDYNYEERECFIMNDDYYLNVDRKNLKLQVCKFVFDVDHPGGFEKVLCEISYSMESGFRFKEACRIVSHIVKVLNRTDWRKEKAAYE